LDGTTKIGQIIGTLTVVANDPTGTGAGWHVSATASPLTDNSTPPQILQMGLINNSSLVCFVPTDSNCHNDSVTNPNVGTFGAASGTTTTTTSIAIAPVPSSGTHYGMGEYTFADNIIVTIPSNSFTGAFSTTITLDMVTA
jgi:hypothetical protein